MIKDEFEAERPLSLQLLLEVQLFHTAIHFITGVGGYGVQFAKLAGLKVIATCSEKNVDFVKKLGADYVIDYTKEVRMHYLHIE